jgi:hypothetical protein
VATSPSFECKITLIEAELSRVKNGDPKKTLELFDLAIKQANMWKYPHILKTTFHFNFPFSRVENRDPEKNRLIWLSNRPICGNTHIQKIYSVSL